MNTIFPISSPEFCEYSLCSCFQALQERVGILLDTFPIFLWGVSENSLLRFPPIHHSLKTCVVRTKWMTEPKTLGVGPGGTQNSLQKCASYKLPRARRCVRQRAFPAPEFLSMESKTRCQGVVEFSPKGL